MKGYFVLHLCFFAFRLSTCSLPGQDSTGNSLNESPASATTVGSEMEENAHLTCKCGKRGKKIIFPVDLRIAESIFERATSGDANSSIGSESPEANVVLLKFCSKCVITIEQCFGNGKHPKCVTMSTSFDLPKTKQKEERKQSGYAVDTKYSLPEKKRVSINFDLPKTEQNEERKQSEAVGTKYSLPEKKRGAVLKRYPRQTNETQEMYETQELHEADEPRKTVEIFVSEESSAIDKPRKTAEFYEPQEIPEIGEPSKTPEIYEPMQKLEIGEPGKQSEVYEPKKTPEISEPGKSHEIYEPEKSPEIYKPIIKPEIYEIKENNELYKPQEPPGIYERRRPIDMYAPGGAYGVYATRDPYKRACQYPSQFETAELDCYTYVDSVYCKQRCAFGYTMLNGTEAEFECKLSESVWNPTDFVECQPFVDCTLRLVSEGKTSCTSPRLDKPPECLVQCGEFNKTETYTCSIKGKWTPALPSCVVPSGDQIIVPKPEDFGSFYETVKKVNTTAEKEDNVVYATAPSRNHDYEENSKNMHLNHGYNHIDPQFQK